jgi:uncharacterized repeat protein (TIGR03803 family)
MKVKTLAYLSLITFVTLLYPAAHAQTFSVIYNFESDADYPQAGVTLRAGNLFGTGMECGYCYGSVFQLAPLGDSWALTPLFVVRYSGDPSYPLARVLFGPDGHLYGTMSSGGSGVGAVFSLTPSVSLCKTANCFWTQNVIHQFTGTPDGGNPGTADLIFDTQGNIYGTTTKGGTSGLGAVYELQPSGNNWTESVLYSFSGPDGATPVEIIFDNNGNLFGVTRAGGAQNLGTVYELTYTVGIGWQQTPVYSFTGGTDGSDPSALVSDGVGNFYGATRTGGSGGGGTLFELSPSGNSWTFKLLRSFSGQTQCGPARQLTLDAAGNIYGATYCDGPQNHGNIFKMTNTGNGWLYSSLYEFNSITGQDGVFPATQVTIDTDGTLYGTTIQGGYYGYGVAWQIKQ